MAQNGTIAYVNKLPQCDFPHHPDSPPVARYDFKTIGGPWAFGCEAHYQESRYYEELGTGKGQKLEARPDAVSEVKQNHE